MAQQETIRIPAYYVPRPEQIEFWKAYHSGIRFFDLCWHRREGKDFTALNATVEEILTKRPGLAWHLFPTLAQGRKVLWDATDNQGRPLTSAFPKQLVTEVNKADMRIKCKYVPDIAEGRKEVRESTWQIVGADNPDSLRGANPVIVVISEFGDIPPNLWYEIIQPILFANGGKAIFVWTPKGRNHAYTLHCAAKESMNDPDVPPEFKWFSQELTVDDTHKWVYENGEEAGIPSKELIDSGKVKCVPVVSPEAVEEARKQGMDEAVLQQEFYCMPGNALVATVSGQSPIEEIRVGDFVLTHTGRMRKVLETMQRQYDGDMIHIKSYGSSDELVLTPNHAVRVYDRATASYTWIPAGELTTDHRITFPRRPTGVRTVDKAFVTLLCWYITEGSCAKNAVQFTLGENETANIKQITKAAKKLGYEVKILHRVEDHTKNVVVCSTALADQLATICGSKAHNKRIPFEWIAGYEQEVLAMLLAGDGCVVNSDSKYPWYMYSTVSEDLAYGIQQLAISVGKRAGISRQEPVQEIMGRKIKEPHARFNVQIRDCNHSKTDVKHLDIAKYCMHARIQSITREHYEGTVYNLKVQYDESYVANGRVVHNCSFNAALKGAYFGDQMNEAVRDGRINNNILHNPSYPVYTGWDLGMNDTMDIVFAQIIDDQIKIIDFYENNGKGLEHYIQYINSKPYTYAYHFGPHDLKVRELGAGSRLEFARKLGLRFTVIPRVSAKEDSINATRAILGRCFFNMTKCHDLIEALKCYTKKWDEKRQVYLDTPLHNKWSNSCDAMQTLAMGLSMYPQAMKKMKMRETEDGYLLEKVDNSRGDDRYDLYNYDRY